MLLRVLTYVFLFLIRTRFPQQKSITDIIRSRYGRDTVKLIRKFEKLDFRFRKAQLGLDFLEYCQRNELIPNFLFFKLANRKLQGFEAYRQCQTRFLNEEITQKKSNIRQLTNEFSSCKTEVYESLNYIDFTHICSLFLTSNDNTLKKHKQIQDRKIFILARSQSPKDNPDQVIFNFSNCNLSEHEKSLLAKGLNFSVPPSNLNYGDYLVNFELLFRDIKNLNLSSSEHLDFLKTKIKDTAISSYRNYNNNDVFSNLSEDEQFSLKNLSAKSDLVIQKSDKGNSVVVIDKIVYTQRVKNLIQDTTKFSPVTSTAW